MSRPAARNIRHAVALVAAALLAATMFAPPAVASPRHHHGGHHQHHRWHHHRGHYDRQQLIRLTDQYLAALVAHDPGAVPLSRHVRTVQNLHPIRPGEGLWATASAVPTTFAIHVPDPQRQTAGFIGVMDSDGSPILLGLRLKVRHGQIVQAEHLVASDLSAANLANLQTPRPGLVQEVPRHQRLPEHLLRAIGATYYDALDDNDASLVPFAPDCERHENGLITAGPDLPPPPPDSGIPAVATDCIGQIDSGVFTYIKHIDNRRVFAADPVTGLAMGLSHFRQPMDNTPYPVTLADGSTIMYNPQFDPFDLPAAHIFKVGPDRQIHEIEAMGFVAPSGSPSGWCGPWR